MCGIFGVCGLRGQSVDLESLTRSLRTLRHRGPDDEGYLLVDSALGKDIACSGPDSHPELVLPRIEEFVNLQFDIVFGFRRLSILDLSPAGHQPMRNANGNLWIVFNGEIYNYIELRDELKQKGHEFYTQSDTEVILNSYLEWGPACLEHFNGMWAFAMYDKSRNRLFCARDRFGIKPFYYFNNREKFVFGSEIKALISYADIECDPNNAIIHDYLAYGLIDHTGETFFDHIKQLPPAHYLIVENGSLRLDRYWDIDPLNKLELGRDSSVDNEYGRRFYELFEDAIRLHLRSDVTVGSCLSGGLDSSSIVCVVNKLLFEGLLPSAELVGQKQKTFSSCFEDPRFDERQYIRSVLSATSAEPNYTFPSPGNLLDELPRLIWHQDEPFGSTSIYAQWCVMKIAAERGVRVLLDGQGPDEMLAGYHAFFDAYWGRLIGSMQMDILLQEWSAYRRLFGVSLSHLVQHSVFPLFPSLVQHNLRSQRASIGLSTEFTREFRERNPAQNTSYVGDLFSRRLYLSTTRTSLPGLLHYEDRNSMAHSIEARVPFLDYRLVEFVFSLPDVQKIRGGYTKYVLRNAMKGLLPESIRMRTDKMGFVTPESLWFSMELKPWFNDIIDSSSFLSREYFDHKAIRKIVDEHYGGKRDLGFAMWRWANLEAWFHTIKKTNRL